MTTRPIILLAACIAALTASGCATTSANDIAAGPEECREAMVPGADEAVTMCGTPRQWAEYERRSAILQPGMSCREMLNRMSNTVSMFCGSEEQWAEYERVQAEGAYREVERLKGSAYAH